MNLTRIHYAIVITVSITIWSLLIWQHFTNGVPSHHPLANEEYPAISNWWGALLLPLITWYLVRRTIQRLHHIHSMDIFSRASREALLAGIVAMAFSTTLAWCFLNGYEPYAGWMLQGALLCSLFIPLYRAEYLLGFILGMTYTIGAVLPTVIGAIYCVICAVVYLLIRPAFRWLLMKVFP